MRSPKVGDTSAVSFGSVWHTQMIEWLHCSFFSPCMSYPGENKCMPARQRDVNMNIHHIVIYYAVTWTT